MRIFEVKNNLVKIFYETSDNLFLSGFVMIKDSRESYIGQIMHLESSKHGNVAIAKINFNVTEEGSEQYLEKVEFDSSTNKLTIKAKEGVSGKTATVKITLPLEL